jgi:hypothetical protein
MNAMTRGERAAGRRESQKVFPCLTIKFEPALPLKRLPSNQNLSENQKPMSLGFKTWMRGRGDSAEPSFASEVTG